jgi:large subunit ribosomal protein L21
MFAVVRTGGKQYRVAAGDKIAVEKIPGEAGDSVTLGDVLLAGEGSNVKAADGLTVAAEIVAQAKGEKVIVFKKRRRHNYRRKQGHRQQYTILRITAIGDQRADGGSEGEAAPKKASRGKAKAADAGGDAPLKTDGAESPMVDAPVLDKGAAPVAAADAPVEADPVKTEPTASEMVDAPKKKSTKKVKADKGEGDAAPAEGSEA